MFVLLTAYCFCNLGVIDVCAQKKIPTIKPDRTKLSSNWEVFRETVTISGAVKVGLMAFQDEDERIIPDAFYVQIPDHDAKTQLCVELSSRDGRYEAHVPYNITGLPTGVYRLELPSKFLAQLQKYSTKEIAILGRIGVDCDSNPIFYVLSAWNSPNFENKNVVVFLNSRDDTDFILSDNSLNKQLEVRCKNYKPAPSFVSYTCECILPVGNLKRFNLMESKIYRQIIVGNIVRPREEPFPIKIE